MIIGSDQSIDLRAARPEPEIQIQLGLGHKCQVSGTIILAMGLRQGCVAQ